MINKVILVGNVGKDPEIRTMSNSKQVASFSLATTETWMDRSTNERINKTEWHNIVVFNEGLIKVVQNYVHKGSKLYIEGSIQTRKWTDANNNDRYTTEIILNQFNANLRILSSAGQDSREQTDGELKYQPSSSTQNNKYENNLSNINNDLDDDEIPF